MDAQKRKMDAHESDTVAYLRRGAITVLEALDCQRPAVVAAASRPKLSLMATLNLAQVSKAYRDSVWSVRGVQSFEAKIKARIEEKNLRVHNKRPLYYATWYGNLPAIRALLQSGVDVDEPLRIRLVVSGTTQTTTSTALWLASHQGDAAVVKELIELGADVNERGSLTSTLGRQYSSDVTPLYAASQQGHTPVVIELIRAGSDVNIPISDTDFGISSGVTPIHVAALKGYEACVAILLQAGADVNKADESGMTPLSTAIQRKHEKVVKLLKHFGAR